MYQGRKSWESGVHSGSSMKSGIVMCRVHIEMMVAETEKRIIKVLSYHTVYTMS